MTMKPIYKTCLKCKKTYLYNPDVGQGLYCPYCMGIGTLKAIKKINKK